LFIEEVLYLDPDKWIRHVLKEINGIKNLVPKDRLESVSSILKCNNAVLASYEGWMVWLSDPGIMSQFTPEDLELVLTEFKELSVKFMENDIKWTKFLQNKLAAKKNDSKKGNQYIS